MTRFAVVLLLAAGCGGGAPKSSTGPGVGNGGETADPIPKTKGPDCAIVADRLATVAHADTPDRQAEARDKLRTRCADDKWSDEARSCFATVETDDEIDGCGKLLTDTQRAQLDLPASMSPKGGNADGDAAGGGAPGGGSGKAKTRGGGTRGATQKSSDPCEGGEAKSDPCEGGE